MTEGLSGWLITVSAGEVAVFMTAVGWLARRIVKSQDRVREKLTELSTYIAVDKVTGPRIRDEVDRLGTVTADTTARVAVLEAWRRDHDRYHERNGVTP